MKGPRSLVVTALALLLVLSVLENCSSAPQRLFERRNWTPQAMLYLKGAREFQSLYSLHEADGRHPGNPGSHGAGAPGDSVTEGRRFISDQGRRKELADRPPPERRNPHLQLLTVPEAAALFLASLQKLQKDEGENFDQSKFLEDRVLNW
ncbi:spexin isoform X2 [Meriones unguiculatus]|uniref:spexin isoform X2 n=1 Tax=Meriones unguiculatus TaxID=10047 RepID=UPI00293EFE34|nr:spexin isoform X2 [Meriones unguiculatus]